MKYKKLVILFFVLTLLISFPGCDSVRKKKIKIGFITSLNETDAFTKANIDGIQDAIDNSGINSNNLTTIKNVSINTCFDTLAELAENGCEIVFGIGKDFEDFFVQAATENPDIHFCILNGNQATNGLDNYHNYSFPEYQTRYMTGVVAALKLNDMLENGEISGSDMQLGYIASYPDSENISAYSAFYLGAKSICENVILKVQYTYSESEKALNNKAALALIANGCRIISQHSYQYKAADVCSSNGISFIGFLKDSEKYTDNYLCDGLLDMSGCYKYALDVITDGDDLPAQWSVAPHSEDSPFVSILNENSFASKERYDESIIKIKEKENELKDGSLKVFDIKNWTVNGEIVNSTTSDGFEEIYNSEEFINKTYFMENEITSNPRFEFRIDGIFELNLMDDYSF